MNQGQPSVCLAGPLIGDDLSGWQLPDQIKTAACSFTAGFDKYKDTVASHTLSTRSMDRLAKVARTVADLAGSDQVEPGHVSKAKQFVVGGMLREGF